MGGINKIVALAIFCAITTVSFGQQTQGRIIFERKTNLKKKFGDDPRMKNFINEKTKSVTDKFELLFNDTCSAFIPIPPEEEPQGFMKYLTSQNSVYQNLNTKKKMSVLDLWGTETFLEGKMEAREWKITERRRKLAGYMCTRAIWEKNDSTRIYAWFSVDLVPSVGPEGFDGLPGAILGLATEDGGVIYFAKEVIIEAPKPEKLYKDPGKNDVYSKKELREILEEKMGRWMKKKDFDEMFSWL